MPIVNVWEKSGNALGQFFRKMNPITELVALKSRDGELYPIYEGHNEVPVGVYNLLIFRPYAKGDPVVCNGEIIIDLLSEGAVVHIVNHGDFFGGYIPCGDWDTFSAQNADKLFRPVGWGPSMALRMLQDLDARQNQ